MCSKNSKNFLIYIPVCDEAPHLCMLETLAREGDNEREIKYFVTIYTKVKAEKKNNNIFFLMSTCII